MQRGRDRARGGQKRGRQAGREGGCRGGGGQERGRREAGRQEAGERQGAGERIAPFFLFHTRSNQRTEQAGRICESSISLRWVGLAGSALSHASLYHAVGV